MIVDKRIDFNWFREDMNLGLEKKSGFIRLNK